MPNPKKTSDRHRHKTVSFRLPDSLMELFRSLATRNRRTLSGEVRIAIENHLADKQGRRRVRRALARGPGDMRGRDIALAIGPNGEQGRRVVARAEEDEAMTVHRARNDGVAVVTDAPDFAPGLGIVADHRVARR